LVKKNLPRQGRRMFIKTQKSSRQVSTGNPHGDEGYNKFIYVKQSAGKVKVHPLMEEWVDSKGSTAQGVLRTQAFIGGCRERDG
jgi:hypothetical protein